MVAYRKHPHKPHIDGLDHYKEMYKESIENPNKFWGKLARELLTWDKDFKTVHSGSLKNGDNAWFLEGVEKSALEGPLVARPKPLWFPSHRRSHVLARRVLGLYRQPAAWKLCGLTLPALLG